MSSESGEWEEKFHAGKQRKYWKNKATGKTTWNEPYVKAASGDVVKISETTHRPVATESAENDDGEWLEKFSEKHQKKYWQNKKTGKSSWKMPPGFTATSVSEDPPIALAASVRKNAAVIRQGSSQMEDVESWDWEEKFHEGKQRKYWKNKTTGKSTWTKPPKPSATVTETPDPTQSSANGHDSSQESPWGSEWQEAFSVAKNRAYWKNIKTGKSQWTEPPRVAAAAVVKAPSSTISHLDAAVVNDTGIAQADYDALNEKYIELTEQYNILKGQYVERESILSQTRKELEELKLSKMMADSSGEQQTRLDISTSAEYEARISELTALCESYKKGHDEVDGITKSSEELTTAYEQKIKDNKEEIENLKCQCEEFKKAQEEAESVFELSYQQAKERDCADYELQLAENKDQIQQLTALCELYKRSHEEAEQRFQEAKSKEQLSAADISKLQEEHDTSVRKLNAELEINIIREKTKGETSIFEITRELNEVKVQNASLEMKCKLLADQFEEVTSKHSSALNEISNMESTQSGQHFEYREVLEENERLNEELSALNSTINELNTLASNNNILLEEYKRSNMDLNAKFAEEKVVLTLELESKTEMNKNLVDKRDELEALNHKLVIERDLLKQLNEEADARQSSQNSDGNGQGPVETIEDVKLQFNNQTRRMNAEMEIKLLEERAAGEKNVLDVKHEYNELKTLHEYLNSRYNILAEEKKMFVTEINHAKQHNREIRQEKDKLAEALQELRAERQRRVSMPPPPPPPVSLAEKKAKEEYEEKIKHYEVELVELQQKYEEISEQHQLVTSQRDEYKKALNNIEGDKMNWDATLEDKDNMFAKLRAEIEMYKSKYEESEIRFHVWENESNSKGRVWTESMKELQMLHESQIRKLNVEFEIQILEERSKGEQKLFASVSKLNGMKVTLSQKEAEFNIKYDTLLAAKEALEKAHENLQEKVLAMGTHQAYRSQDFFQLPGQSPPPPPPSQERPVRPTKARFTHNEADLLKTQLFSIIKRFDDNDTPPNSPPATSDDDTPPNSPPPSDDEGDSGWRRS